MQTLLSPPRKAAAAPASPFQCSVVLVQEKGATSTFRMVYCRMREEWRLDIVGSPLLEQEYVRVGWDDDVMDISA